jgi:hypothetical protein
MCWRFSRKMASFSFGISDLSLNKIHSFIFGHYAGTLNPVNFICPSSPPTVVLNDT